ncbi:MAG: alpha/beta hydrolase [Myxococcota bacterium]
MIDRDVHLSDGTLRVRIDGEGPPIVFAHGALANGRLWDGVVERLRSRFTCVVPELPLGSHTVPLPPGADRTPAGQARRIAELLVALDLRDVTLVGNDSGGAVSQLVAADHAGPVGRGRLGRLVLTNCDALEVFPPRAFAYLTWLVRSDVAMGLVGASMRRFPALARLPNAYGWLSTTRIDDALLRSWLAPMADAAIRRDVAGFFAGANAGVTTRAAEALRGSDVPVRLVWGQADPFFTPALGERLAGVIGHATLVPVPDAACYVPLDAPDAVAREVEAFATAGALRTTA